MGSREISKSDLSPDTELGNNVITSSSVLAIQTEWRIVSLKNNKYQIHKLHYFKPVKFPYEINIVEAVAHKKRLCDTLVLPMVKLMKILLWFLCLNCLLIIVIWLS